MPAEVKEEYISTMTTEIDRRAQDLYVKREARRELNEARKELKEARKEREDARKEGHAEGRAEAAIETARNMKALGIPNDIICQCTGLSENQISSI